MEEAKELLETIREYFKKAEEAKRDHSYNVAVTLYFKAIAVLIDLYILKKEGFIPSNHNERFRLLELKYPLVYKILDKDFPVYQRSYRIKLTKEHSIILENDFKTIVKFTAIKIS